VKMKKRARVLVGVGALAAVALGGCYERTVSAKGMGAEWGKRPVYEPNLKTSDEGGGVLDGAGDALLGPRKIQERR